MEGRDLQALFAPAAVAVVGASDAPAKWGTAVARSALAGADRRAVYLVNRSGRELFGRRSYPRPADLPEPPDLAVLVVPAAAFEEAAGEALAAGARALVAFTAGLGEASDEGRATEARVAAAVRAAGAAMIGPNCMGVTDVAAGLDVAPWVDLPPGDIALVSQSGNLTFDLADRARALGIGFSRFVSLGNQADLTAAEVIVDCIGHAPTRTVAVYCEDFRDGRAFAGACRAAVAAGKRVLLLAPGRTDAGARAARSHTGSLASAPAVVDAVCRATGALRVHTPRELMELAYAVGRVPAPAGRRVAVVTTGGGNGVIAADVLASAGLEVPPLAPEAARRLDERLPHVGSSANPVDLVGATLEQPALLAEVSELLLRSGEADAVLLTGSPLAMWHGSAEELARREEEAVPALAAVARAGGPVVLATDRLDPPAVRAAMAAGLAVFRDVESAAAALARLAGAPAPDGALPALPPPAEPVAGDGYWAAREALAAAGVPFVAARIVEDESGALRAAAELGYPVALKALGSLHKSDAGGVTLGLADPGALAAALADMRERLAPPAFSVERMAPLADGVELIAGCRRDPRFGPVALAGLGGIHAELLGDVELALAPLDEPAAEALIRRLRGAPLLLGARGRPALDVAAAAAALAAVSRFAAAHPEAAEVEVNPLLALPRGALALDARIVLAPPPEAR